MEPTKSIRPLEGGGDMGALMRGHDWSTSALGPTTTWPQSLRTALSILLDSHFGMYIAWGRDYVQFYNDRYRPILGATKHPAIGKRASETFAESWHIIGPLFDQVMGGEAVGSDDWMLPLDRNGYLEECFFTFSYSPVRDESGDVGGVLVTVAETTARVLGERRLRTLRDLAARAAGTTDETPAWIDAAATLALNPADIPFALLSTRSTNRAPVRSWPRCVVWPADRAPCRRRSRSTRRPRRGRCRRSSTRRARSSSPTSPIGSARWWRRPGPSRCTPPP